MSVTILETLINAEINFWGSPVLQREIARDQLHNAVVLLKKGYPIYTIVEPLLEEHGSAENVPDLEHE